MKCSIQAVLTLIFVIFATGLFAGVTVVTDTDKELVVDFTLDSYSVSREGDFTRIQVGSMTHPDEAGEPNIPFFTRMIAVPPGGSVRFSTEARKAQIVDLEMPLVPIPKMFQQGADQVSTQSYSMDRDAYNQDRRPLVEIVNKGSFRDVQTVTVRVNPFSYDHKSKTLSVRETLRVRFTYEGNTAKTSLRYKPSELLQSVVLNPSQAEGWRTSDRDQVEYADFAAYPIWMRIEVKRDGIFKISSETVNQFVSTGLIDPTQLRLFGTGGDVMYPDYNFDGLEFAEIPIYVQGESDHSFDPGDYILFYGRDRDDYDINFRIKTNHYYNPYSQAGVYWLTFGDGDSEPERISTTALDGISSSRTTTRLKYRYEEEKIRREDDGFDWYSKQLGYQGSSVTDYDFSFNLADVATEYEQKFRITLRELAVAGISGNHHQLDVFVNNNSVLSNSWNGPYYRTFYGDGTFAQSGTNALILRLTRTNSTNMLLDYYEVEYNKNLIKREGQYRIDTDTPDIGDNVEYAFTGGYSSNLMAFEVDDFDNVKLRPIYQTTGGFAFVGNGNSDTRMYVVSTSDCYSPDVVELYNPVDLTNYGSREVIIITPEEFRSGAEELKSIYQDFYGYDTQIASLQEVFDQFSGGMADPCGVKMFLEHSCLDEPDTAPTYAVFLGAGVYDWRNFANSSIPKNRFIAFQILSTTSDDFFVYFTSANYPEMAIGRYPAQTLADLELMIGRVRQYLENPTEGFWKNKVLILADDQYNSGSINQISHTENAQENAEQISPSVYVDKVMAIKYELDAFSAKPQVRDLVVDKLNEGALVFYYTGHGAPHVLGDEKYLTISDIPLLQNSDKLPLFIAASCSVGRFENYETNSLAEEMLFAENGGALVSLAASCETSGDSNTALMGDFLENMINSRRSLGISIMNAKVTNSNTNSTSGNNQRYILMGDPVLRLVPPAREENIVIQGEPDSLKALQTVTIEGDYNFDDLSEINEGVTTLRVYDTETEFLYYATETTDVTWTEMTSPLFRGQVTVEDGAYDASFIVPYDITGGTAGRMIAMTENGNDSRISYLYPLKLSTQADIIDNFDSPKIEMWLDSRDFVEEDAVTSDPLLIADISDSTGVNILGKPGHKILVRVDDETSFIDATEGFSYNLDSYTSGELNWQMEGIPKGLHTLELIAFDNANEPSVQHIDFEVSTDSHAGSDIALSDILPYPNPFKGDEDFYFTFVISHETETFTLYEAKISVYTITGKKIKTIERSNCKVGYNQIRWDVRDDDGDRIANNTYIYKIKVKDPTTGKSKEKTGKMIVYR